MSEHLIRLAFNGRVNNYEDKIAYIADRIKLRFGDRVDAELPLSRRTAAAKLIYLKTETFGQAMALADEISSFLHEKETVAYLGTANIRQAGRCVDSQYARGWRGTFAQRFDFESF